jgi:hypothetical protein
MTDKTLQNIIDAVNHNAELLEKHLGEGVYVHQQEEPSCVWRVNHKLGSLRPLIEVFDLNGNKIGHAVNSPTQTFEYCEITFAVPMNGTAILRF